jgi:hypothetical protein
MTRIARKYDTSATMFRIGAITRIGRYNVAKLFYIVRKEFTFFSFLINKGLVERYNEKKRRL